MDWSQRMMTAERMDDPALDRAAHDVALRGLARINALTGSVAAVRDAIKSSNLHRAESLRVLDVASGAGDVAIELWRYGSGRWHVEGCDVSPAAVAHARKQAQHRGAAAHFFVWDALREPLPQTYDIVMCNLFLHHLRRADAIELLRVMAKAAKRMLVVNDLHRCRMGYWLARWGPRLLTRSAVVHHDAIASVRGAYTPEEAEQLARDADLHGATVIRRFPWRWQLIWRRT